MTATLEVTTPVDMNGKATANAIELHAFMLLRDLFKERHWTNPCRLDIDNETTGEELLSQLDIPAKQVDAIFVNHRLFKRSAAIIKPGDRVALISPGAPIMTGSL